MEFIDCQKDILKSIFIFNGNPFIYFSNIDLEINVVFFQENEETDGIQIGYSFSKSPENIYIFYVLIIEKNVNLLKKLFLIEKKFFLRKKTDKYYQKEFVFKKILDNPFSNVLKFNAILCNV